jgi:hypothetical protein
MAVTINRSQQVTGNGIGLSAYASYAYSGNPHVAETVADGTTSVDCVFKYTALRFLAIFASGALTLQAKNAAAADIGDPITVSSTKAFIWACDDGTSNWFTDDIVSFSVVNATGADVTLNIEPLTDATP